MKKTFWSITMLFLIAVVSAFSLKGENKDISKDLVTKNFVYTAYPDNDPAEVNDPLNYVLTGSGGSIPLNCPGGSHRCGVIAIDDGTGHPDFSQTYTPKNKN